MTVGVIAVDQKPIQRMHLIVVQVLQDVFQAFLAFPETDIELIATNEVLKAGLPEPMAEVIVTMVYSGIDALIFAEDVLANRWLTYGQRAEGMAANNAQDVGVYSADMVRRAAAFREMYQSITDRRQV